MSTLADELQVCGAFPLAVKREALPLLWETWRKAGSAELSLTAVQICVYLCIYETLVQKLYDRQLILLNGTDSDHVTRPRRNI